MAPQDDLEPIAVVGMACRFPGASNSPSELWDLIKSPRNLSRRVPSDRFNADAYYHPNGSYHGATDSRDAYFLDEDVARFDNAFFNIQPAEAEAIDPQQRLLLETVYDSLCAGGQTIEHLRGTNTAVYVGMMCDDWAQAINRDWEATLTYAATGESRAIISNRLSYFFDWHGPSITVDTACSSSLVAVHQGVTSLRTGESPVAIAAGSNLILGPGMWIAESKLHMLSPTGTSKMWDESADGYARGEGVAAIVMKRLSDALRDGDPIECVIRATGVNQDGKTAGLTMPNNRAQAQLIRDTYRRAGLDILNQRDRPQFFHAHGTGTQAGDGQEAQAISSAFFPEGAHDLPTLSVGSIKTIIGHTEGSAGLASLIGSAMAIKHATIPPNLHFHNLSPKVEPFYHHLDIPTTAIPWPELPAGVPRRVSVNSFGFGGLNSHAIIESYEPSLAPTEADDSSSTTFTPLTVSAASSSALKNVLGRLRDYLNENTQVDMRNLAHTLHSARSTLSYRKDFMYRDREDAINQIDELLSDDSNAAENGLASRHLDVSNAKILGVFTGQGAQWPRMGARLIEKSPFAAERFAELDCALSRLPEQDRPSWTLREELCAGVKASRLSQAAIAQPLCTAVQVVLVDLLNAAGIKLSAVVGHSSGEIGAAYAAGHLSAADALYIAYYRGLYAHLAGSDGVSSGSMLAVGTSFEDAMDFCQLEDFLGRIQVAARNSATSVTLSGEPDAVEEAESIFDDEGKFARALRVDTAYHSNHMLPCFTPYLEALRRCNVTVRDGNGIRWFSSVKSGHVMSKEDIVSQRYWADNMVNTVLFEIAVETAVSDLGGFDMAIECGPHPALKGPYKHVCTTLLISSDLHST